MKIRGVHATAFTAANLLAIAGQNDLYNTVSDSSGGDGVVLGADSRIFGMSQFNNNAADGSHIVSSGNALVAPTAWENKLYGLHLDGNLGGDWLTTHTYTRAQVHSAGFEQSRRLRLLHPAHRHHRIHASRTVLSDRRLHHN